MVDNIILVSQYVSEHLAAGFEVNAGFLKLTDKRFSSDFKMGFKIGDTITMRNRTIGGIQYGLSMTPKSIEESGQQLTITDIFGNLIAFPMKELMFKFKSGIPAGRALLSEFYDLYLSPEVDKIVQEACKLLLYKAALNFSVSFGYSTKSISDISLLNTAKSIMSQFNMPVGKEETYFLSDFVENDRMFTGMKGSSFTQNLNEEIIKKGSLGKAYSINILSPTDLGYIHIAGIGAGEEPDETFGLIYAGTTAEEIPNMATTIKISNLPPETEGVFNAGDILNFIEDVSNPTDYANYKVYPLSYDTKKRVNHPLQRTIKGDAEGNIIVTSDINGECIVEINEPIYSLQTSKLRNVSNTIPAGTKLAIHGDHKVNLLWTKPALVSISPKMAESNLSYTASKMKDDLYIAFESQSNILDKNTLCRVDTMFASTARAGYGVKMISMI